MTTAPPAAARPPAVLPVTPPNPMPSAARSIRLTPEGITWLCQGVAAVLLSAAARWSENGGRTADHSLLLLLFGLAMLAALLPASGPRGQRVGLLPGVGLAAALLLPPFTATLPLLLASALYAATRETPAARRTVLTRGAWLVIATLVSGWMAAHYRHYGAGNQISYVVGLYAGVYLIGRFATLPSAPRRIGFLRRLWHSERLEMAALAASVPVAALMTIVNHRYGTPAVAGAAGLMALLLVIAYFGFEVALLREQVRAMEKISAVTLSQTNPQRVIERFLQLSSSLIPCDRASLWLTDDSQTRLERVARRQSPAAFAASDKDNAAGRDTPSVRFGEGLVGRVADRQSPLIVRDGARDPRSACVEGPERGDFPFALLLLPLVTGGETIGVAQFERDAPGTYTNRDIGRVRSLAAQVAATVSNVRLHRDVYTQAITDGLTGLYNRRHMQASLADERTRAGRYGHQLSVIMLDVDGFKSYNDTYGHPQGDVLLKMIAALLRDNVREVDIVGRYGGEEFIILMPETPKFDALRTAERLRASVAATVFPGFADDPDMVVFKTISLGVATFPRDAEDGQELVQQADQALYRAKRGGRNQVVEASPALEMGLPDDRL